MSAVMNKTRLFSIIKGSLISEKTTKVNAFNTYSFSVLPNANKIEIKQAVEEIFKVKVKSVCTLNVQGKKKATGRHIGRRQDWKKAYVTLMPGQSLDSTNLQGE